MPLANVRKCSSVTSTFDVELTFTQSAAIAILVDSAQIKRSIDSARLLGTFDKSIKDQSWNRND